MSENRQNDTSHQVLSDMAGSDAEQPRDTPSGTVSNAGREPTVEDGGKTGAMGTGGRVTNATPGVSSSGMNSPRK